MRLDFVFVIAGTLSVVGCGGSNNGPAQARAPSASGAPAERATEASPPIELSGGSSDGQTCEQARAAYVEEMTIGAAGQQDLSADDFAAVLNQGTYLEPCAPPAASKLRICAAVQNGHAVGVTVAADPASAELETCVAKQVRNLSFPTHAKMDVVNVRF
jgi:eukaryotic-like serine/threonine-protein kinase